MLNINPIRSIAFPIKFNDFRRYDFYFLGISIYRSSGMSVKLGLVVIQRGVLCEGGNLIIHGPGGPEYGLDDT